MKRWAGLVCFAALMGTGALVSIAQAWQPAAGHVMTRWAKEVSASNPLPEYPRPQMERKDWKSLNGLWEFGLTDRAALAAPTAYPGHILVPYPYESTLSGVGKPSIPDQKLWYRREFTVPAGWKKQHILLHFDAANWESKVTVNGLEMGTHRGGYDGFTYDITPALKPGPNALIVSVQNPVDSDTLNAQVLGKQRLHPGGIFYTAATGIWQSVWMEPVPAWHITGLKITPDIDAGVVHVKADVVSTKNARVRVQAIDGTRTIASRVGPAGADIAVSIPHAKLWSPEDPHLYTLKVSLMHGDVVGDYADIVSDTVGSYVGMRKIALGKDARGRTRIFLNNKFVFQVGALDQGYWPDGIYTAPTDNALRYDIEFAKKMGFNLLRKHAKVEPDRWYYWTDKLGILVWQDMPQAFGVKNSEGGSNALSDAAKKQWIMEWEAEIAGRYNHPSIIVWTTFNEGWGQHDTAKIVDLTKKLDPSRLVNNASGWTDMHVGDISDTHAYPGPWSEPAEASRAAANGEFGGLTMRVPGHMWTEDVFGYGKTLKSGLLVTQRYQALLKKAYDLREEKGVSGVVYTQLTDVEQESNGLITYDRAVVKPDAAVIFAANQGRFPALPPDPNPPIVPTSEETPQTWRYTTDKPADSWFQAGFDAANWKSGPGGFGQGVGSAHTPWNSDDIWIRREVTLPIDLPAKLMLSVFHDEDIEVYINGILAYSATGFISDYVSVPMTDAARATLKPGKNVIAAHCHQTVGGQFLDVGIVRPD